MITVKIERAQFELLEHELSIATGVAQPSEQTLWQIVQALADGARARWVQLASERLHTSRRAYIQAIQPVVGDPRQLIARIDLADREGGGNLANLVEQGMDAVDLHDWFLGAGRGRMTADGGRVRAIPFRHATPTAGYGGAGQAMGAAYAGIVADPVKLGKAVYKAAKKLSATTSEPGGGGMHWGQQLRAGIPPGLVKPTHRTDPYAGMYRMEKMYGSRMQSQYITFRTISMDAEGAPSPQGTWLHPGIQAANLAEEVVKYVEEIASKTVAAFLGKT